MTFNSYEEEIDYILEFYGPSTLVLSEDEEWILYEDEYRNPYEYWNYNQDNCLKEVSKINWLKEGF